MYARVNMIFCDKDRIDDGLAHIEDSDRGAVEATEGNKGLATLVDRKTSVIVAISYWDESLRSSEAMLTKARAGAAAAANGDLVTENFEVAAGRRVSIPAAGAAVRMARVQVDHARLEDIVAFYRDDVVPRLERCSGLCSAELLLDPDSGTGVSLTAWADPEAATDAESVLVQLREEASSQLEVKFTRIESYTMVRTSARIT